MKQWIRFLFTKLFLKTVLFGGLLVPQPSSNVLQSSRLQRMVCCLPERLPHLMIVFDSLIDIGQRLCLNALSCIDYQQRPFTGCE